MHPLFMLSGAMRRLIAVAALCGLAACAATGGDRSAVEAGIARFDAANPHETHTVRRPDGHGIRVREFGAVQRGVQPTIVMMHGFPDNQHLYDRVVPLLGPDRHVLTFDFLGWGDSDTPAGQDYPVSSQRIDLQAVVDRLAPGPVVLVVHDLSGQAGIDWALDNPERVARLVLLNTYYLPMPTLKAPEAIEFYASRGILRDLAAWGASKSESRFRAGVSGQLSAFLVDEAVRAEYVPRLTRSAATMRPAFFSSTSHLWDEVRSRDVERARMARFERPVSVVFGVEDPFLNTGVARAFAALFPGARLSLVENAGHYVQLDAPHAVAEAIR
ncbi:MAG: alpha/beta fold hydrolase [Burkholderiaceae bacterium]